MSECDTMTQTKTQIETAARVLGVTPSASLPVVKAAYRGQVKKYHPDVTPAPNGAASSRLLAVLDAFEILSNQHLRAQYDALLAEQRQAAKAAEPLRPEPPPSRAEALARGAFALFQLSVYAAAGLLALLVLVGIVVEVSLGK
jgi:curved DNA-binding protein